MPKMKSHSSTKDRFKVTGSGKVRRFKMGRNHLLSHKSSRRKRSLNQHPTMSSGDVARLKQRILLYSK